MFRILIQNEFVCQSSFTIVDENVITLKAVADVDQILFMGNGGS